MSTSNSKTSSSNKPYIVDYKLVSFASRFERPESPGGLYIYNVSFRLAFDNKQLAVNSSTKQRRFVLCNMQPYPSCLSDSAVLANNSNNTKCSKTWRVVKYFDKREKSSTKTVVVTMLAKNSKQQRFESVFAFDSASNESRQLRNGCPLVSNELDHATTTTAKPSRSKAYDLTANSSKFGNETTSNNSSKNVCDWIRINGFTIGLVVLFVLFFVGFILLFRLVFFKNNYDDQDEQEDYCKFFFCYLKLDVGLTRLNRTNN